MKPFKPPKLGNCISYDFCGQHNSCYLEESPGSNKCSHCFRNNNLFYVCKSCEQQYCYLCMVTFGGIISNRLLLTKHFPSFDDCLDEHDMNYLYLKETNGFMGKHCNIWCFIGEIIQNISFMRPHVIVRDMVNVKVSICFYLDNGSGNDHKILSKLQVGSLMCVRYALKHHFLDHTKGIRLEDSDLNYIKFIPNLSMKQLINIDSTGCLMEYYQNDVLKRRNKIRLNDTCWYHNCDKTQSLSRCGGCLMALYCCTDHQRNDWRLRHKTICKKMKEIQSLCAVDLDIHSDEKEFVDFKENKKELLHNGLKKYFKRHTLYNHEVVESLFYARHDNYYQQESERTLFQSMFDRYHDRQTNMEIVPTVERYRNLVYEIYQKLIQPVIKNMDDFMIDLSLFENEGINKIFQDYMKPEFDHHEYYPHRLCLIECWKIGYRFAKKIFFKYELKKSVKRYIVENVLNENYKTIYDDMSDGYLWWQCDRLQHILFGRECGYYPCSDTEDGRDGTKYKMCKGCRIVYYCSKKCQKKDWKKGHKLKCQAVNNTYSLYTVPLVHNHLNDLWS